MAPLGFLLDMDGVIYSGGKLIPGADTFVKELRAKDLPFLFLTNNSQFTPRDVVIRLKKIGIKDIEERHIYTSAMATANFLESQTPRGTAFVIGEGGLLESLMKHGYRTTTHEPDYVVVGEGRNLTLEMAEKAIEFLIDGAKLVATNLDPSPRIKGWMKPGISAIIAMLENASGKKAFSVGKPSPVMLRAARKAIGLSSASTVIVGDTMQTDILGGVQMGYKTILTLSGWSTIEGMKNYSYSPDLIVNSIADLSIDRMLQEGIPYEVGIPLKNAIEEQDEIKRASKLAGNG